MFSVDRIVAVFTRQVKGQKKEGGNQRTRTKVSPRLPPRARRIFRDLWVRFSMIEWSKSIRTDEISPSPPRHLLWHDAARQVVEHADEIESPPGGSVMEAFWYMVREGGLWESLEGSSDWVADFLLR